MISMLTEALKYYGMKEIKGDHHNPDIVMMFNYIGHRYVKDDETAWCSAFMIFIAMLLNLEHSDKLTARSWLSVGSETQTPMQGDVVVFWRVHPDSWKGHVGIYVNEDDQFIYCLGGNQSDMVKISAYRKSRVLGYRKLKQLS